MPETVVVSPSTGNLATMAWLGVSCRVPPKGMRTVAAPMVESKRSDRPLLEHTLRSLTSSVMASWKDSQVSAPGTMGTVLS